MTWKDEIKKQTNTFDLYAELTQAQRASVKSAFDALEAATNGQIKVVKMGAKSGEGNQDPSISMRFLIENTPLQA